MKRSQPVVLAFCFAALIVSTFAIRHDSSEEPQRLSPEQVDQLWANGLWETLLAFEDGAHEERMAEFFTSAIEHAENKAPVYVSYGVNDSGGWRIGQAFHELVPSVMIEGSTLSPLPSNAPWRVRLDRQIRKSLAKQTSRFLTGKSTEEHFEHLANLMNSGTDLSLLCFQAAVAEDPSYMPGWYFLAMYSEGEPKKSALLEWARRDPENAFPLYLLATDALEARAGEDDVIPLDDFFELQLRLIEEGNKRSMHRQYAADWPSSAPQASWSDAGDMVLVYEDLNNQPVTLLGMKNLSRLFAERFVVIGPSFSTGSRFRYSLIDVAEFAARHDNEEMALRIMKAMFQMGLKKHQNVPYDDLQEVGGLALLHMSLRPIEIDGNIVQLVIRDCKLSDVDAASKNFSAMILFKSQLLKTKHLRLLRGEVDLQKWEQEFANHYLREPPEFFAELPTKD